MKFTNFLFSIFVCLLLCYDTLAVDCVKKYGCKPGGSIKCCDPPHVDEPTTYQECGIIDDSESELSENGEELSPSKAPWAASVYYQTPTSLVRGCSGTLISPFHVLTVEACVLPYSNEPGTNNPFHHVALGPHFSEYGYLNDKETVQYFNLGSKLIQPENYEKMGSSAIVILKLRSAVTINKYVRPVCIDNTIGNERDLNGKIGKIVHWEDAESKNAVRVKVKKNATIEDALYMSKEECNAFLGREYSSPITEHEFCAFSKDGIKKFVDGYSDMGAGLVFQFEKKHYIYGLLDHHKFTYQNKSRFLDIRKEDVLKFINGVIERDTKKSTELAVKGDTYIPSNVPWAAGIYSQIGNDVRRICSGTLISPIHVLTAAICVHDIDGILRDRSTIKVALGQQYLKYHDSRDTQTAQYFDVEEIIIPDAYEGDLRSYSSDIAVLKLSTEVKNTTFVQPVCVGYDRKLNQNIGKMMYWNSLGDYIRPLNETFKIIDFPYKSYEECKNFLKRIKRNDYLTKDKFCSYSVDGDKIVVPRTVDAGAGLIFVFNDTPCVYGVASKTVRDKIPTFTDIRERNNFDFIKKNKANYVMIYTSIEIEPY